MPKNKNINIKPETRYACCIDNAEYPASLELAKIYPILSDRKAGREGFLRIIDESGEDYLYPKSMFRILRFSKATRMVLKRTIGRSLASSA